MKKKSHRGKRKKRVKSELEGELKQRDDEMAQLTDDLADLIPVSEQLKEDNEQLKTQVDEGEQERIDMLGHIDAESKRCESLKKEIDGLKAQNEELNRKQDKANNENNVLRESIGSFSGLLFKF